MFEYFIVIVVTALSATASLDAIFEVNLTVAIPVPP
jgi:hypothetical protein